MTNPASDITSGISSGQGSDYREVTSLGADMTESFSEAQTKYSALRGVGCVVETIGAGPKQVRRPKKRGLKLRGASIEKTNATEQTIDVVILDTADYDDAIIADYSDLSRTQADLFADGKVEMMNDMARICDKVILHSLHSTFFIRGVANKNVYTPLGTRVVSTGFENLTEMHRASIYHKKTLSADNSTTGQSQNDLEKFEPKDLDLIKRIFRKRNIGEQVYMTLTTELDYLLRTDPEFVASERIFNPSEQVQNGLFTGFNYRGVQLLPVLDDALPDVVESSLGFKKSQAGSPSTAQTTAGDKLAAKYVISQDLSKVTSWKAKEGTTASTIEMVTAGTSISEAKLLGGTAIADASTGSLEQVIEVDEPHLQIVHAWIPRAVRFATRSANVFTRETERSDLKHARQLYYRIDIGCINVDSDFACAYLLKGKSVKGKYS